MASPRGLVESAGLGAWVTLPGWVDDPGPLLHAAGLVVCSSHRETLGNVVLEAWAHGKPILATRSGGPQELIVDGETGLLVDPGSPQALARGMRRALSGSAEWRRAMGERGRERVRGEFSVDRIRDRYLELYRTAPPRR